MAEEKKTTLERETYNGTQVVRAGESTVPAFEKTCWKCGTKFLYISDAIKQDKDGDYVICPSCGAFISHQENPKTADFIPPKCASDAKCEDSSSKVGNSMTTLEEAATEFANQDCVTFISRKKGFIAGAKWQKEQMMTNEEMKCALRMEYEKGVFDTKQQMLKDAVEADGVISKLVDKVWVTPSDADKFHQEVFDNFTAGQTVKIIIVPQKEE